MTVTLGHTAALPFLQHQTMDKTMTYLVTQLENDHQTLPHHLCDASCRPQVGFNKASLRQTQQLHFSIIWIQPTHEGAAPGKEPALSTLLLLSGSSTGAMNRYSHPAGKGSPHTPPKERPEATSLQLSMRHALRSCPCGTHGGATQSTKAHKLFASHATHRVSTHPCLQSCLLAVLPTLQRETMQHLHLPLLSTIIANSKMERHCMILRYRANHSRTSHLPPAVKKTRKSCDLQQRPFTPDTSLLSGHLPAPWSLWRGAHTNTNTYTHTHTWWNVSPMTICLSESCGGSHLRLLSLSSYPSDTLQPAFSHTTIAQVSAATQHAATRQPPL